MVPARRVEPGQALWARGVDASTPAAFCSALQAKVRYVLPEDVLPAIWQVALRHFAERQLPEAPFRRVLEQRAAVVKPPIPHRSAWMLARAWLLTCCANGSNINLPAG
jgi:hypothetical protein